MFRVEAEKWVDLSPQMKRPDDYDAAQLDEYGLRTGPYRIIASMMHGGLGPSLWWLGEETAPEETGDPMETDMAVAS